MPKAYFQRVGSTKIIPISLKLLTILISLLLMSNFATNFVNSLLSRAQIVKLNNTIMVKQLKDLYTAAGNQFHIYAFTGNKEESIESLRNTARHSFEMPNSLAAAFNTEGRIFFYVTASEKDASSDATITQFSNKEALQIMNDNLAQGIQDGAILFVANAGQYYGVYKYHEEWDCYFLRAELLSDTMRSSNHLFGIISIIIVIMVSFFLLVGLILSKKVLNNVQKITQDLYQMQQNQKLSLIDLSDSPNDDVTYLAASFNSLSSTINTLLGIFQKFVPKDVVAKAYREHQVQLEGSRQDLVMLFSDIRNFTYRTETLGNDIIDLLNVHYRKVIQKVHENSGVIGSIIGDAILAVYGTQETTSSKSLNAVDAAWQITRATAQTRSRIIKRREEIEKSRMLTEEEEKIYKAVLIDIGVGIDGGTVFYGNIGSEEHMTNTVIGDPVNSASRLEGLTRIYKLPIIVSQYIRNEIVSSGSTKYFFFEIDTVQVMGKTEEKKIYFPFDIAEDETNADGIDKDSLIRYEEALQLYYKGDWDAARTAFKNCGLPTAEVFLERMGENSAPADWSGVWIIQTK